MAFGLKFRKTSPFAKISKTVRWTGRGIGHITKGSKETYSKWDKFRQTTPLERKQEKKLQETLKKVKEKEEKQLKKQIAEEQKVLESQVAIREGKYRTAKEGEWGAWNKLPARRPFQKRKEQQEEEKENTIEANNVLRRLHEIDFKKRKKYFEDFKKGKYNPIQQQHEKNKRIQEIRKIIRQTNPIFAQKNLLNKTDSVLKQPKKQEYLKEKEQTEYEKKVRDMWKTPKETIEETSEAKAYKEAKKRGAPILSLEDMKKSKNPKQQEIAKQMEEIWKRGSPEFDEEGRKIGFTPFKGKPVMGYVNTNTMMATFPIAGGSELTRNPKTGKLERTKAPYSFPITLSYVKQKAKTSYPYKRNQQTIKTKRYKKKTHININLLKPKQY